MSPATRHTIIAGIAATGALELGHLHHYSLATVWALAAAIYAHEAYQDRKNR